MKKYLLLLSALLMLSSGVSANWLNVAQRGAKPDGKTLVTGVIQKAIDEAAAAGGGVVYFPAGTYLTGALRLKSNITLHIDAGAELRFSDNPDHFLPFVQMRWEGTVMNSFSPLLYAYGEDNITIEGRGLLNGQGQNWWKAEYDVRGKFKATEAEDSLNNYQQMWVGANKGLVVSNYYKNTIRRRFFRPPFFQTYKCTNIQIRGVKFINSPFWTINPAFCQNVTLEGVTIENPPSPNTDGINPTSCKDVHISNCHLSVGDDCITIKSGRDADGRKWNTPCENITVTNCTMLRGHGGVVIGSEVSGSVRKVTITNCVFDGTDRGIRLKSSRERGGIVEEIRVSNIVMKDIKKTAFTFDLFYDKSEGVAPVTEKTPCFRNIHISNVTASQVNEAGMMMGIEEMPISNISFNDVNVDAKTGFALNTAREIEFHNVTINTQQGPSFILKNAENLVLDNVKSNAPLKDVPVVTAENVKNIYIYNCFSFVKPDLFLKVVGNNCSNFVMKNSANCPVSAPAGLIKE